MQQLLLPLTPPPAASFENFILGENEQAVSALRDFLELNGPKTFVLWGGTGVGKTHLLQASARALGSQAQVLSLAEHWPPEGLIILDINSINAPLAAQLFLHYNEYPRVRFLLSLSQALPSITLREDLKTRLLLGQHFPLLPLREEAVLAAIDHETLRRGFLLSKEVVAYLFKHWQRDIRSLLTVIDGLDELSLQKHRPITVPLLKDLLAKS